MQRVTSEFSAIPVAPDDIYSQDVDIYSPCALGAIINDQTIPQFKANIVAGSANNQLAEPRHGEQLKELGILYAPDYVINAGGIINVSLENHYNVQESTNKVGQIFHTLSTIFQKADAQNSTTSEIADNMAREIIQTAS